MLSVQYASKTSKGLFAPYIGWINFGSDLSLSNASPTATITNAIPGGYTIRFELTYQATASNEGTCADLATYSGDISPTYGDAPFGNTAYTGIGGYPSLYTKVNQPIGCLLTFHFALNNLTVLDCHGCTVTDFLFFAAECESTHHGYASVAVLWSERTGVV